MHNKLSFNQEIYRKIIHLSSSSIALTLWYFGKETVLPWFISLSIILTLLDYGRHHFPILYRIYNFFFNIVTRPIEYYILSGATWVVIGATSTIIIFNELSAIIGLLVLSIADSASAMIGMKFGKTRLFNKSLEGTTAFILTASFIILTLSPALFIVNLCAVLTVTAVELFSTPRYNDNLFIPLVTAFILTIGGVT